jgi:hypothetical protein
MPQMQLFSWEQVETASDMDRLRMVLEAMADQLGQRHPALMDTAEFLSADKAYDSKENNRTPWDTYETRPIIDIRSTWKAEYKHRTADERGNSRFDLSFGFEQHFIRGLKKMRMRCGLALVVMRAMAAGRIRANQAGHLRSLVRPAA